MKILYVEDDESFRWLAKQIFIKTNHDLVVCPSIEQAKNIVKPFNFDLIILDMCFPTLNGVDLLEYMRLNKISIPVFIYSGYYDNTNGTLNTFKPSGLIKSVYSKMGTDINQIIKEINSLSKEIAQ